MRENNRNSIEKCRKKLPQFTTMNVIDGQAGLIIYTSLIFYSLTIDNILNIIVLLILAGISIAMLTGQNGILNRASEAKDKTGISQEEESVKLSISDALTQGLGSITTENLQTALTNKGLKGTLTGDGPWVYTGEYKKYDIEKSGSITSKDNSSSSSDRIVKVMGNYGVSEDNRLWELDIDMDNIPKKTWTEINKKREVSEIGEIQKAICDDMKFYVLTKNGEVYAWGRNNWNLLGFKTEEKYQKTPVKINELSNIEDIYSGGRSMFAKNKSGEVYAWGNNNEGQLGIGNKEAQSTPVKVKELSNIEDIYIYYENTFAKNKFGEIYAWGYNGDGRLGIGNTENQSSPIKVNGITNVKEIYTNGSTTFTKNQSGEIYAWGYNGDGRLGIGNTENQSSPIKVNDITNVEEIYIDGASTFAKTNTGEVYAWGNNDNGQLGIGNTENQSSPIKVNGITNVEEIYIDASSIDGASVFAKTNTGEVYAWGNNRNGQLGIGNTDNQLCPVKINGLSNVEEISFTMLGNKSDYLRTKDGKIYIISGENNLPELYTDVTLDDDEKVKNTDKIVFYWYDMSIIYTTQDHIYAYFEPYLE